MKHASGQAMIELVMLLLGFTVLILGIVFTCGLELSNNELLLSAKVETQLAAHRGAKNALGQEISNWKYMEFDDAEIPFSGQDRPTYSASSSVGGADYELKAGERSEATNYFYRYPTNLQLNHMERSYRNLDNNAFDLANLVQGFDPELDREPIYTLRDDPHKKVLYQALKDWCGVKIDGDTLKNNPSNQVYIPQNTAK